MTERELRILRRLADETRALHQEIRAIREQHERNNQRDEQPTPMPTLRAELQIPEGIQRRDQANSDKQHRIQAWMTLGTWLAFAAAAIYAGIALGTWHEIERQTPEITKSANAAKSAAEAAQESNRLNRQLTEGSSQAVCYVSVDCRDSEKGTCQLTFTNVGHVAAKALRAHVEFSLRELPSNIQIGRTYTLNVDQEELIPRTTVDNPMYAPGHGDIFRPVQVPMLRSHRVDIENGTKALMINAMLSYDNGFGSIRTASHCEEIAYGRTGPPPSPNLVRMGVPCEGPYGIVSFVEEQKKLNRDAQQQNPKQPH